MFSQRIQAASAAGAPCRIVTGAHQGKATGLMGLVSCKECKRDISSKAAACPHCGLPIAEEVDWGRLFLGVFAGPPLMALGLAFFGVNPLSAFVFLYVLIAVGLAIKGLPKK